MKDFRNLIIICNGCGNAMRDMGEWPVQYPKDDKPKNIQQAFRYFCGACRTPHWDSNIKIGIPVGVCIVLEDDISGDIYQKK